MIVFLVLVFLVQSQADDSCRNVVERSLKNTNTIVISEQVSQDSEFELRVETNLIADGKHAVLVRSELLDDEAISPLYFGVGHSCGMRSWKVPSHIFPEVKFAQRVFHPPAGKKKLRIFVSSESIQPQRFKISVSLVDFLLQPNEARPDIAVSPNAPSVSMFKFPENGQEENFLLKITNTSLAACTLVSIQKAQQCPYTAFFDEESNIKFGSSYQTMLQKSAMIVSKELYPDGFYLVLLGKSDTKECFKKTEPTHEESNQHSMNVTIVVESLQEGKIVGNPAVDSIFFVAFFYLGLLLVFSCITWILDRFFGFEMEGKYGKLQTLEKQKKHKARENVKNTAFTTMANMALPALDQVDGPPSINSNETEKAPFRFWGQEEWQPQREDDEDTVDGGTREEGMTQENCSESEANIGEATENEGDNLGNSKLRPWVSVARPGNDNGTPGSKANKPSNNFCTLDQNCQTLNEQHRQHLRSHLFSWLIVLAGIFYALPAFQMVYNHQNPFIHGGDLDICYYNFFCVFPLGKIADFGHVFSNVGYVISGLYFVAKVWFRKRKFQKFSKLDGSIIHTGIPEQVGIFYALGGALALEGVLSGIYHICPTSTNFQFDTTFMFLIAVLIFLKLYQFRHADTTLTAQFVFLVIGVVLTLEVIGYFTSDPIFWVVFIFIYIICMLIFILKIYLNEKSFKIVLKHIFQNCCIFCSDKRKTIRYRSLVPCITVIIINILMAIFFATSHRPGVSRYLLVILMANMMLYEVYYVFRKLHLRLRKKNWRENEGIRVITLIYLNMSFVFMLGACYFFIKALKTSAGTPAESRNLNEDCTLLIFDNHDMWHFLSAAGLYQHFMFLLTLEDYNIRHMKKRKLITVF